MNFAWQYNHLVIPLAISIGIAVVLLYLVSHRRKTFIAYVFIAFMVCTILWIAGSLLELITLNLALSLIFADVSFLGITIFPILWVALAMYYSGKMKLFLRMLPYLLIIPLVTNIIIWTNAYHHLWRIGATRDLTTTWFPISIYAYGVWFNIHLIYSLALALIANGLYIRAFFLYSLVNRTNILLTIFAPNVPLSVEVLHQMGIQMIPHFNVSVLVFPISGLSLAYVVLRQQLLELTPIARSHVVETMQDIMLVVDKDGLILDVNTSARKNLFSNQQRLVGKYVAQLTTSEMAQHLTGLDESRKEIIVKQPDGDHYIFEMHRSEMETLISDSRAYLIMMRDITKRKQVEEDYHTQLKQVAILEERQRLARELHDSVNQTLFAAGALADLLPLAIEKKPESVTGYVTDIRELISGTTSQLRLILMELYPEALVDTDMFTLIDHLCRAFTGSTGIPVKLNASLTIVLEEHVKVAFYRITQESLHNINKHTRATLVNVSLEQTATGIRLTIEDNGQGFDRQKVKGDHFGLDNMRQRAVDIGAEFSIDSVIGQGTCISVCAKV